METTLRAPSGGIALDRWLDHLEEHLPIARQGDDPEGVHQVRAAAARLDVWLRLGGYCVLRPDLRWLRKGAGAVRDIDVLLARGVSPELEAMLRERLAGARPAMLACFSHPRTAGLLFALRCLPPLDREPARRALRGWTRRAQRRGRRVDFRAGALEELHGLRRHVRRLRFAREWLELPARKIKRAHDELGALNDLAVLLELSRACSSPITNGDALAIGAPAELVERSALQRVEALRAWSRCQREISAGA